MPHFPVPHPGFQAIILCGPGVSLNTFTSSPKDFPKALVPIANRPMVWYAIDWCYRMGVSDITLITPPESEEALRAALDQNPYLTSFPSPKPDILAPKGLTQTTYTAQIFQLSEVQDLIKQDFIVLPCDLICELEGHSLTEAWMVEQGGLGGATGGLDAFGRPAPMTIGGEKSGRRGGLTVWYDTDADGLKKLESDFHITAPLPKPKVRPPASSLRPDIEELCMCMSTDTMNEIYEDKGTFPVRSKLIRKRPKTNLRYTYRDAHIYFLPYWVKDWLKVRKFDTLGEDVLGWWAKATWQGPALGDKLKMREVLAPEPLFPKEEESTAFNAEIDLRTYISTTRYPQPSKKDNDDSPFASRVRDPDNPGAPIKVTKKDPYPIPNLLAYIQPFDEAKPSPLIRRIDTTPLLLNMNLRLAKLTSIDDTKRTGETPSPFAHQAKIRSPKNIPPKMSRVEADSSLLDSNVTVGERANVKESVIGAGCEIGNGARIQRCVLMEGVIVGENVTLNGCVLGRRCKIEGSAGRDEGATVLKDCEVAPGFVVSAGTEEKDHKFMSFEGLSDEEIEEDMEEVADGVDGLSLGE